MNNHPDGAVLNRNLDRRSAHVFPVSINIEWRVRLDKHALRLKVFHLANLHVPTEVNGREQTKEFEEIHATNHADVEQPLVQFRVRRDLHAAAVGRSIGESGEYSWLVAANCPVSFVGSFRS